MITTWPEPTGLGTARNACRPRGDVWWAAGYQGLLGELVGAFDVFDAGRAPMPRWVTGQLTRRAGAEAAFFTAVPFGLTAQEMNGWIYYGGGLELWQELYEPFGLVPLPGGNTGVQMGGWFNTEINSLADFQGLRMRIPGLGGQVFERAGGVAVAMPGGDMFTSLQTGTIDATEWVGPYNDLAFGLTDCRVLLLPGLAGAGPVMETLIIPRGVSAGRSPGHCPGRKSVHERGHAGGIHDAQRIRAADAYR